VSLLSGKTFSHKGAFQGSDRYFRDDEVADAHNTCPDMIIKHTADPTDAGDVLFGTGSAAGSAMLYSVEKNNNLGDTSESYSWVSGAQDIGPDTCHVKADAINGKKAAHTALLVMMTIVTTAASRHLASIETAILLVAITTTTLSLSLSAASPMYLKIPPAHL